MRSDLDFSRKDLFGPVVFRPDFNGGVELDAPQAWSLFFSAGNEDKVVMDRQVGLFFNNVLAAIVVAGALGGMAFTRLTW